MNASLTINPLATNNKLPFASLISAIFYLTILFGISFEATSPPTNTPALNLDIILVKQQTVTEPENADFLAQVNNDGGSNKVKDRPAQSSATPKPRQSIIKPMPVPLVETAKPKPLVAITQAIAPREIELNKDAETPATQTAHIVPKPVLSANDLILKARQEAALLDRKHNVSYEDASRAPKKLIISSRSKQYAMAAYAIAWNKKNENIGNLNYPIAAKRRGIYGSLTLSVDINPDGSVPLDGIVITRSSGHKVLDDAAINIVRMAAPYPAIPQDVLQDHDMITITRKWNFKKEGTISAR